MITQNVFYLSAFVSLLRNVKKFHFPHTRHKIKQKILGNRFVGVVFRLEHISMRHYIVYNSVSQPPGRGPVPVPGFSYTGPREVLLEFVILVF